MSTRSPGIAPPRAAAASRPGPAAGRGPALSRPVLARVALLVAGLGLGVTTALAIISQPPGPLGSGGGLATFIGSLTGLTGTYLALVMVLLVSRIPFVERVLGQDGLVRWHRRLAPWPIGLLIAHGVFITVGYAQAARTGAWHEIGVLVMQYPDMLTAVVALGLMCLAGAISVRAVRRRVRRETWWAVHLYLYLALAISFAHVIVLGPAFVGHPLTQAVWSAAWAATAGLVLCYRFARPAVRGLRYQLRVAEVRREAPDVVSIVIRGRGLDRLAVAGGQFMLWRFLARDLWWQAHPYSVSALPRPPYLRLTVKAVGDHSAALAELKPGTRVLAEGPYGAFTRFAQQRPRALLVAAGIGVTALRALLEDLPRGGAPVVILRGRTEADIPLLGEVRELTRHRRGRLHELTGRRDQAQVTPQNLQRLVPDLGDRDVFVCGPEEFVADVVRAARDLGVPAGAIHHEAFAL